MKYRVLRPMTYAGHEFVRDDVITDTFVIDNGGRDKLAILLRTRYIEDVRDYRSMLKDELVDYARRNLNLKFVDHDMTKAEIVDHIDETLSEGDAKQQAASKSKRKAQAQASSTPVSAAVKA